MVLSSRTCKATAAHHAAKAISQQGEALGAMPQPVSEAQCLDKHSEDCIWSTLYEDHI